MSSKLTMLAASAAFAVFGVGAAQAAQSTVALNVRSGPSTAYGVVDTLYAGEQVDVQTCQANGWCRITHSGPDGWVASRYLADIGRPGRGENRGGGNRGNGSGPDVNFSINTPGFSFSIGNGGDFRMRPGRRGGQVCFYEHVNYRGARFCASPGERDARLASFNDRISSIRIRGDAQVQVCEHFNYRGRCAVLDRNRSNLGGRNNDIISSYRVR